MNCENCGKEHDGSFGSGRFCSRPCANTRKPSKETKEKIKNSIQGKVQCGRFCILYEYTCENCGINFVSKKIREERKKHCIYCKRKVAHKKENPKSILDVSKRTSHKILRRSKKGCSICGWNNASCDIHHILPKEKGGEDNDNNLIVVCPNCHREIHWNDCYSPEFLYERTIEKIFPDWLEYYYE